MGAPEHGRLGRVGLREFIQVERDRPLFENVLTFASKREAQRLHRIWHSEPRHGVVEQKIMQAEFQAASADDDHVAQRRGPRRVECRADDRRRRPGVRRELQRDAIRRGRIGIQRRGGGTGPSLCLCRDQDAREGRGRRCNDEHITEHGERQRVTSAGGDEPGRDAGDRDGI